MNFLSPSATLPLLNLIEALKLIIKKLLGRRKIPHIQPVHISKNERDYKDCLIFEENVSCEQQLSESNFPEKENV